MSVDRWDVLRDALKVKGGYTIDFDAATLLADRDALAAQVKELRSVLTAASAHAHKHGMEYWAVFVAIDRALAQPQAPEGVRDE